MGVCGRSEPNFGVADGMGNEAGIPKDTLICLCILVNRIVTTAWLHFLSDSIVFETTYSEDERQLSLIGPASTSETLERFKETILRDRGDP